MSEVVDEHPNHVKVEEGDNCPICYKGVLKSVSTSGGGLVGYLCVNCDKLYTDSEDLTINTRLVEKSLMEKAQQEGGRQ